MVGIVFFTILLGVIVGSLFKKYVGQWVDPLTTILIWLLLFSLGIEIGARPNILSELESLGFDAVAITIASVAGSAIAASIFYKWITKKERS